ncbi:uroporphyrinogen-III C-methyltransferase [Cytophagaceae bacterium ABcell3]|nr:uroporphyrinogen-III C-methyltransferase [Cytophagaceae bacterium ABcell3]
MRKPKLTLVGAGPGDPDLITVKGLKTLAEADVVLYDALAHPDLLNYAPARAIKIFVGKLKGVCQFPQEDINQLIVDNAKKHGHVVRLKGGDPFIFGRGHEEILFAQSHGVETEIVPGISSSIAVPELQQIPLTRRGINESFWVVTGTTRNHQLSEDIKDAARSKATVVILMGMTKLREIMGIFANEGKSEVPVAIIQHGTLPKEKYLIGKVGSIVEVAENAGIGSPAIIVVGEVVSLHPDWIAETVNELKTVPVKSSKKVSLSELPGIFENAKKE